jgi:hypothetical protein
MPWQKKTLEFNSPAHATTFIKKRIRSSWDEIGMHAIWTTSIVPWRFFPWKSYVWFLWPFSIFFHNHFSRKSWGMAWEIHSLLQCINCPRGSLEMCAWRKLGMSFLWHVFSRCHLDVSLRFPLHVFLETSVNLVHNAPVELPPTWSFPARPPTAWSFNVCAPPPATPAGPPLLGFFFLLWDS